MKDTGVYHSSTLGKIPMSLRGKQLMENLRHEVINAIQHEYYDAQLSRARGELAKYISELEAKVSNLSANRIPTYQPCGHFPVVSSTLTVQDIKKFKQIALEIRDAMIAVQRKRKTRKTRK